MQRTGFAGQGRAVRCKEHALQVKGGVRGKEQGPQGGGGVLFGEEKMPRQLKVIGLMFGGAWRRPEGTKLTKLTKLTTLTRLTKLLKLTKLTKITKLIKLIKIIKVTKLGGWRG